MNKNNIIETVFECKESDLCVLDNVGYDLEPIIRNLMGAGIWPRYARILGDVFGRGIEDLCQFVNDRLCQLEAIPNERSLEDGEECEKELLMELNPWEDVNWHIDGSKVSVYFVKKGHVYRHYLADALKQVESRIGFAIERDELAAAEKHWEQES